MLNAKLAASIGAKPREGVFVSSVFNDTPAKQAGLQARDIILAFNGRRVNSPTEMFATVERSDLEAEHEVTVFRNKKIIKVPIKVVVLPPDFSETGGNFLAGQPALHQDRQLGVTVIPLTPDAADKYNYQGLEGVIVMDVTPGSRAANAGIKSRMLITHVDDKPVKDTDSYIEIRKESSLADGIKLNIESEDGPQEIIIKQRGTSSAR
jgi:serine protease Do